ncbi:hypothetical protein K432DRAFT_225505 [Lepidopterella palustris CBS 459.81]|uniref:Uncharacterized protein n=1 Tax=Lepidopterella palustris CBS 459.81 TaxID=1314670 RepID=A0A8E2DXR7_9PEZI|nr:hypothetical protein K432DRAFT_225505 [Lepidopterella palustris CBS 459.81]
MNSRVTLLQKRTEGTQRHRRQWFTRSDSFNSQSSSSGVPCCELNDFWCKTIGRDQMCLRLRHRWVLERMDDRGMDDRGMDDRGTDDRGMDDRGTDDRGMDDRGWIIEGWIIEGLMIERMGMRQAIPFVDMGR